MQPFLRAVLPSPQPSYTKSPQALNQYSTEVKIFAHMSYVEDAFSCLEAQHFLEIVAEYSISLANWARLSSAENSIQTCERPAVNSKSGRIGTESQCRFSRCSKLIWEERESV